MRNYTAGASVALATLVAASMVAAVSCGDSGGTTNPGVVGDSANVDTLTNADGSDTGTGDTSDTPTDDGPCPPGAVEGKIADLLDPSSAKKIDVGKGMKVTGVVATSGKFQVSKSKTVGGTCLYGVFVADANATFAPYSGIFVVAQGTGATATDAGGTVCTYGDLIPNDVKPGDVLTITGIFEPFGATALTCNAAVPSYPPPSPAKQAQLTKVCALTRTGTSTPPAPADVSPSDLQHASANVPKWMGGLVRVKDVKAEKAADAFGTFKVTGSTLIVIDKIYYRGAGTAPIVKAGDPFTEIVGLSYLDFCTWSLAPRTICDLKPVPGDASKCP